MMNGSDLGQAIKTAIRGVSESPLNTYQERLMDAFATAVVSHITANAKVKESNFSLADAVANPPPIPSPPTPGVIQGNTRQEAKGTIQ